jgi:Coenzyme PQQ synthesis protein D (PqqD)
MTSVKTTSFDQSGQSNAYKIAGDHVVSRTFEDELTLINLATGDYFAAGGVALELWQTLAGPVSVRHLIKQVCSRYQVDPIVASREVQQLVDLFLSHALIVEVPSVEEPDTIERDDTRAQLDWPGGWFEAYSDMKELLLLDPVHDVGEGAWPPKPDSMGR